MYRKAFSVSLFVFLALLTFSFYATTYESSTGGGGFGSGSGGTGGPGGGNAEAPEADFTWSPDPPEEGNSVSFQDQSIAGDGAITTYEWTFEGHGTATGPTTSVTFSDGGSYQVTLKVTDDNSESDTAVKTVNVQHDDADDDDPGDDDYPIECHALISGSLFDSDQNGETGLSDPGCVAPLDEDDIEGSIWENHMSTTMEGDLSSSGINRPQFFMSDTATLQGNDLSTTINSDTYDDSGASPDADIYFVDYEGSEGGSRSDWGFGILANDEIGVFQSDATVHNDRIVRPPHNLGSGMCGDGFENDDEPGGPQGDDESSSPPDSNDGGYTTDCRADYGRQWERYDVNSGSSRGSEQPAEPGEQSSHETQNNEIHCRDDNMEVDGSTIGLTCDDGTDASCSDGDSSCPCGGATGSDGSDATCEDANDWSVDEGNEYWYEESGDLVRETCQTDGTETYASGSSGSDASCTNYDGVSLGTGSCQSCVSSGDEPFEGGDDASVSGTNRAWNEVERENCDIHDTTDGGTNSPGDYENNQAATFTHFTSYFDSSWGDSGRVWCGYDYTTTVDADGPQGLGDGFVVIEEDSIVATENLERNDRVGDHVYVDGSNIGNQNTFLNLVDTSCDGDRVCVKYVNFYTSDSFSVSDNPSASEVAGTAVRADVSRAYTADESYSVCKNINRIHEENGDGHPLIDCDYSQPQPSGGHADISPLPEACGDDYEEHVMVFDGNEVDETVVQDYPSYHQRCVSWDSSEDEGYFYSEHGRNLDSNSCVIQGREVAEGTVANVASVGNTGNTVIDQSFEEGQDSPDWEVCLNIDQSNSNTPYNHRYNDASNTAFGGQWYDLDDEVVNDYLRSNEGSLGLSTDQRVGSPRYIDYYYGENPSPYDSTYNPEGGRTGTSLVADCGPLLEGCGENQGSVRGAVNNNEGTYFGFLEENAWDDDAHPHGGPSNEGYTARVGWRFIGHMNMIKSLQDISGDSRYSGQLSSGHPDYEDFSRPWHENTMIDSGNSVLYSYTLNNTWVIDSTGAPYPAYSVDLSGGNNYDSNDNILEESGESLGVHYDVDYSGDIRTGPNDDFVVKTSKAMGNSLAVLSNTVMNDEEGNEIEQGEAFWIDPDDIRYHAEEGHIATLTDSGSLQQLSADQWQDLTNIYEIDLTGPDSGLGWDYGKDSYQASGTYDPDTPEFGDESHIVYTRVSWENDSSGDIMDPLEPPLCGDDGREYLLEEQGEAENPEQFTGTYTCATTPDYCVYDRNLYEPGDSIQTNEPGEEDGRLKQDEEVCSQDDQIADYPIWFDQDYTETRPDNNAQNLCKSNSLYGTQGQRWIGYNEINSNPHAFTRGIDDSWNARLNQEGHAYYTSDYEGVNWDDDPLDAGYTPVQTGFGSDRIADPSEIGQEYGFCGGDDVSEYLVFQDSESEYVQTDQSVIGTAASPDSCVLDNSRFSDIEDSDLDKDHFSPADLQNERMLYQEGDTLSFESGDTRRTIACFGGQWWSDWPITFLEDVATVNRGSTGYTSFRLINPTDSAKTFELGLNPRGSGSTLEDLGQMVSFEETGSDEHTVTVPAGSSTTHRLEIRGNRDIDTTGSPGTDIEVFAQATDGSLNGEDQVDIATVEGGDQGATGQSRTIPGLTFIQLIVIAAISSLIFFRN